MPVLNGLSIMFSPNWLVIRITFRGFEKKKKSIIRPYPRYSEFKISQIWVSKSDIFYTSLVILVRSYVWEPLS